MKNVKFIPATITVKRGTTVRWRNNETSTIPHTVTRNAGPSGPLSGVLYPGETFDYTFTNTGSYLYRCAIHPTMTGSVIVTK